jgi:hypothetical protein
MSGRIDKPTQTCKGCAHFLVTHDPNFPYACSLMGYKSRNYPHIEVLAATGEECVAWQAKPRKTKVRQ